MTKRKNVSRKTLWDRGRVIIAASETKWDMGDLPELSDAVKRELRGVDLVREALGIEEKEAPGL